MSNARRLGGLAFLLCLLFAVDALAGVRAWVDRTRLALGETVTLNVQVDGAGADAPDYSGLEADFELLGSSSSSQISITNGQRSATTLFAVGLAPRREGVLTIPAFEVEGESTAPITVEVTPSTISTAAGGDLFIETEVTPRDPYVQQSVDYTVRLFYAVTLIDGQLDAPAPAGTRMLRLGDDTRYEAERGGRRYQVIERRFALVPERSGPLHLDPPRFAGRGMDRNGLGGMFGGGTRLAAGGQPTDLEVRAKPAAAGSPWLPAKSLSFGRVENSLPLSAKVGEPLTLTLRLRAQGLAAEQLPELVLPDIDGASVYPDQESPRDSTTLQGVAAEKTRRFAIVPTRPGTLQIPELAISWWDVGQDSAQRAVIPAQSVSVEGGTPAPSSTASAGAGSTGESTSNQVEAEADESAPASWRQSGLWPWLSLVLGSGWAITVVWMQRARRSQAVAGQVGMPPPSLPRVDLSAALASADLHRIAAALRALAPPDCGRGLDAIAAALDAAPQQAAVQALERALYADPASGEDALVQLRRAFAERPRWRERDRTRLQDDDALPPLYR